MNSSSSFRHREHTDFSTRSQHNVSPLLKIRHVSHLGNSTSMDQQARLIIRLLVSQRDLELKLVLAAKKLRRALTANPPSMSQADDQERI